MASVRLNVRERYLKWSETKGAWAVKGAAATNSAIHGRRFGVTAAAAAAPVMPFVTLSSPRSLFLSLWLARQSGSRRGCFFRSLSKETSQVPRVLYFIMLARSLTAIHAEAKGKINQTSSRPEINYKGIRKRAFFVTKFYLELKTLQVPKLWKKSISWILNIFFVSVGDNLVSEESGYYFCFCKPRPHQFWERRWVCKRADTRVQQVAYPTQKSFYGSRSMWDGAQSPPSPAHPDWINQSTGGGAASAAHYLTPIAVRGPKTQLIDFLRNFTFVDVLCDQFVHSWWNM